MSVPWLPLPSAAALEGTHARRRRPAVPLATYSIPQRLSGTKSPGSLSRLTRARDRPLLPVAAVAPPANVNVLNITRPVAMNDVHDEASFVSNAQVDFEHRSQFFVSGREERCQTPRTAAGHPPRGPTRRPSRCGQFRHVPRSINLLFRRVRDQVLARTNNGQEPFTYGSLPGEEFYFKQAAAR
jgi:hypothetical protein